MLHAEAIQRKNDVLLRCTTINMCVIDFLRAKNVIDDEQASDLKAEISHQDKLILLFQWLKDVSPDKYESFLQVMKDTEQEHVANLLTGIVYISGSQPFLLAYPQTKILCLWVGLPHQTNLSKRY